MRASSVISPCEAASVLLEGIVGVGLGFPGADTQLSLPWASPPVVLEVGHIHAFRDPQITSRGHHVVPIYSCGRQLSSEGSPFPTSQRTRANVTSRRDSDRWLHLEDGSILKSCSPGQLTQSHMQN